MSGGPKRTQSGESEAVKTFRKKLESVQDSTLEELLELNRKLDAELEGCPNKKDPRREGESAPPVDRVEFPTAPPPPKKKP